MVKNCCEKWGCHQRALILCEFWIMLFSDLCTTPRDKIIASSLANFMNGSMKALFKCATKSAPAGDDSILIHMCRVCKSPYLAT